MKVEGKAALVTGGAQGLGKGFTNILLQHGAKVLFTDINKEQGEATLKDFLKVYGQSNVMFVRADVTSEADMKESFQVAKQTFRRLDIVVNNAGILRETESLWPSCVSVNLTGAIRGTRLALSYLRKDQGGEGGVIINICSVAGIQPFHLFPVYSATKAGLLMYSRSVAADPEVAENGVRVNVLCPDAADTQLIKESPTLVEASHVQGILDVLKALDPLSVENVTECLYELVTDDSKNGAVLAISKAQGKTYISFPDGVTSQE